MPLALRKSTWKHRGVIPPVCMHHGGGAAHPHYLWCVFFLFILVVNVFSLRLLLCTRATPHTRRTNHAMDFGCAEGWPDNIPEAQVEQQAKPRC